MTIRSVETWACSVPLPYPLSFGTFEITSREYTVVRITTPDGHADCVALSRRAPMDVVVHELIAPHLLGRNGSQVEARMAELYAKARMLDLDGVIARALSLVNICLWDLRAKSKSEPLWQTLGGSERNLRLLVVEGYSLPGESDEQFAQRLAKRAIETGGDLKIEAASYSDPKQLRRRLERIREICGYDPRIVIDMAWSWANLSQAREAEELWRDLQIAWIEDPFPRDQLHLTAQLRKLIKTPLGAADEVTRPQDLIGLVDDEAIDVVRIDSHAIGGISAAEKVAKKASAAGLPISLHTHAEIHEHCALAWGVDHVEIYAEDQPFDCTHNLIVGSTWQRAVHGGVSPRQDAGSGVDLNLEAVNRTAYRRAKVG